MRPVFVYSGGMKKIRATCVALLGVLCALTFVTPMSTRASSDVQIGVQAITASLMGVEVASLPSATGKRIVDAGAVWLRRNALLWSSVEPIEGARNWAAVAALENDLHVAAQRRFNTILIVRSAPTWAQARAGSACGPVRADKLAAFGTFMRAAVARYSKPPFGTLYFEIGNEPDVDTAVVQGDSVFGCWGNSADPNYGGGYYAEALKAVYPKMKAANPRAQVLVGGLLLDCDPSAPPAGRNCIESRFLEGILRAGGGAFFDAVSFHAYDFYSQTEGSYANPNWGSAWNTTGPAVIRKAKFLRDTLAQFGVNKPILATELGLICWQCATTPPEFERTKVNYMPQIYAVAKAINLRAGIWFSWEGWFGSGLVTGVGGPTPALTAYQVASTNLGRASFVRERTDVTGARVYEFMRSGRRLWVMWPADGTTHTITLPAVPLRMFNAVGTPVKPTASILLGAPVYVEWR